MQALSFSVHIPLVAFGISFPAMVLFVEWLWLRTGDELYLTLARRWTRVMVALFAVGVITGTVLSFEMGLLWPNFTGTFGGVFGLGFAIEGFSFFMEAIFIGIYVYGWGRLSPRAALPERDPDRDHRLHRLADGDRGQRLDEPSGRVPAARRQGRRRRPVAGAVRQQLPVARADPHVHRRLHRQRLRLAAVYAFGRLRGRWGRYERTALTIPLTIAALASPVQVLVGDWAARDVATTQPIKLAAIEGLYKTTRGAPEHILGWYADGQIKYGIGIPHLLSLLAFHSWNATVQGLDSGARRASARRSTSCASRSRRWSGSARCWRCSASSTWSCWSGGAGCPSRPGSTARSCSPGRCRWSR